MSRSPIDVAPALAPRGFAARVERARAGTPGTLASLVSRFHFDASDRGIVRLRFADGDDDSATRGGRRHVERARAELAEYLAGGRTVFTVPIDLTRVGAFQSRVLAEASAIPYGAATSYAAIARRIGRPHAARAVGNALAANPVPIFVPCHRVVRGDGTWGHYAFGAHMKTELLVLERVTSGSAASTTPDA